MSKPLKKTMTREYQSIFEDVAGACVVDLTRMDAGTVHELRGQLRQHGMRLRVVKNRIFRQAYREGPLAPLAEYLQGPCAVVTGESVIDVAKELVLAARDFPALTLKDGLIEGDGGLTPVKELAKMMSLGETRAHLVFLFLSPGRKAAAALQGGGRIAGCLKFIIDKLEKEETIGHAA
ncbi:MAG: 50S ribosomal protein L10 [Phycisphaerales bacterium]|nr:MAG: 50S ribosomal protein L10 [Phycisphaerales bacterium]